MVRTGFDLIEQSEIIIPVPLHPWRLWYRRYNQAALLAQSIAQQTGRHYNPDQLIRIRHTQLQGHLSKKHRYRNVAGVFKVTNPLEIKNKKILLIDDVLTTGATLESCTTTLLKAGAQEVSVLTLARLVF
jgi:ComF family protein